MQGPVRVGLGEGRVGEAHRLRVEGVVASPLAAHDLIGLIINYALISVI